MNKFVENGLFTPIIEDLNSNVFKDKGRINAFTKRKLAKAPKGVTNAIDTLYVSADTVGFKKMLKATQYGDIIARYAVSKSKVGKSFDTDTDLFRYLDELFVNYSYNENKYLKYANDTAIVMFTKYFFRVGKAMIAMSRKNPLTVWAWQGAQGLTGIDVVDPVDMYYNPIEALLNRQGKFGEMIIEVLDPNIQNMLPNPSAVIS